MLYQRKVISTNLDLNQLKLLTSISAVMNQIMRLYPSLAHDFSVQIVWSSKLELSLLGIFGGTQHMQFYACTMLDIGLSDNIQAS